jgi:arylsulfatase A-like enzyme
MDRQHEAGKPFFTWFNSTRMHYVTHVGKNWEGKSGLNFYADGMLQHDSHVGKLLKKLDDLGISENTIVIYSTDNGPHFNMWPDGGITPFRSEKNTNWDGGYRVPFLIRWPGQIDAGEANNEVISHTDWVPTLMAAAGVPDIKEKLVSGYQAGPRTYKVHLDGYNLLPMLTGKGGAWPRKEFFYWNDDGQLVAMRYDRWKLVFMEQRSKQFGVWMEPFVPLRVPLVFDLRMDPFERAQHNANSYYEWMEGVIQWAGMPGTAITAKMVATFKDFPPRQKPASFNVDDIMSKLTAGSEGK